jgi:hypothetical protein
MSMIPQERIAKVQAQISAQKDLLDELSGQRRAAQSYPNRGGFDMGKFCARIWAVGGGGPLEVVGARGGCSLINGVVWVES